MEYQRKRDIIVPGLREAGYEVVNPEGAFYIFPKSPMEDDVEFTRILQEQHILIVPGSGFGCPGHFRLAYCVHDETLRRALPGFRAAMDRCR
jgi:aspartate aminotransferase